MGELPGYLVGKVGLPPPVKLLQVERVRGAHLKY